MSAPATVAVETAIVHIPGQRGSRHHTPPRTGDTVWRARLLAGCLLLAALCFTQAPGQIVPDTKLDLTANPGGFMRRALSLWDASNLGQLQNQAYGYLFPVGPFHLLFHALGTPAWITQRLWWTTMLSVAFTGMWLLSGALGLRNNWGRYLGALLFALSPRFLAELTITSVEVWPMAMGCWVLLPLVSPTPRPRHRRIMLSATAFGCIGGINAVATGVTLVLPTLWWLTRRPSWRTTRWSAAWLSLCLLAASWWIGPLLLLGRYSPPFLAWIESAAVTTRTASPFAAFQGTTAWLGWLVTFYGPAWPAGFSYVTMPLLILTSSTVAVLGLAGLAHPRMPERRFLSIAVLAGMCLLTLGFHDAHGFFAPSGPLLQNLLDGPLAAVRNIHKFEMVMRIPLTLGLIHLFCVISQTVHRRRSTGTTPFPSRPVAGVTVGLLVVATAAPAFAGALVPPGPYTEIPQYWRQAAAWLDRAPAAGTALVVPQQPFARFSWGFTKDEPLQALTRRPYAVRDLVPFGSAGATRLLDGVGNALASGNADETLRASLAGAGVAYVVVRNDVPHNPRVEPLAVHQALSRAGLRRVITFGPWTGSPLESSTLTMNEHTLLPRRSIEIYAVGAHQPNLLPLTALVTGDGGPEDAAAITGATGAQASVLGSDVRALGWHAALLPHVTTDGLRRREADFGAGDGVTSATMQADEAPRADRPVTDYVPDPDAARTFLRFDGLRQVRASSSASDVATSNRRGTAYGVAAAFDGDPQTGWASGTAGSGRGDWLEAQFPGPVTLRRVSVTLAPGRDGAAPPSRLSVTTDRGARTVAVTAGRPITINTAPGSSTRIRFTLAAVDSRSGLRPNGFSIKEIVIPGRRIIPRYVMPGSDRSPSAVVMRKADRGSTGCYTLVDRQVCSQRLVSPAEEAVGLYRSFSTDTVASFTASGTVRVVPSPAVERLIEDPGSIGALASSRSMPVPTLRPQAAVDGDLATGWVAGARDPEPTLHVDLRRTRRVTGLQILTDQYLPASRPTRVRVRMGGTNHVRTVSATGSITLPAIRTDRLSIQVLRSDLRVSVDSATGARSLLPAGISELRILGAQDLPRGIPAGSRVHLPCGFGPPIRLDGRTLTTRVDGSTTDVLRDRPLRWTTCGPRDQMTLTGGSHLLTAEPNTEFTPQSLTLSSARVHTSAAARTVPTARHGPGHQVHPLPARTDLSVFTLPQNANPGWTARLSTGQTLTPVRLDGWKQGWMVPAGEAAELELTFVPQAPYRAFLSGGGLILAGVIALSLRYLIPRRTPRHRRFPVRSQQSWPVAGRRSRSARLIVAVGLLVLPVFAGAVALAALAWAVMVTPVLGRIPVWWRCVLTAAPAAVGVLWTALHPYGRDGLAGVALTSNLVHWTVVASLAVVCLGSVTGITRRRHAGIGGGQE